MKTLIIVDAQYDFLEGGSLEVTGGNEIIPVINDLIPDFDLVIFTRDYHPAGHASFASSHDGASPFTKTLLNGKEQVLWPDHCVQNTRGSEIHEDLIGSPKLKGKQVYIFKKGTDPSVDSYSGFYDNNGTQGDTGLADFLKEKGVDEVFITGLAYDFCVAWTAGDAARLGLKTFVIKDATRAIDPSYEIKSPDVEIITTQDLIANV